MLCLGYDIKRYLILPNNMCCAYTFSRDDGRTGESDIVCRRDGPRPRVRVLSTGGGRGGVVVCAARAMLLLFVGYRTLYYRTTYA